MPHPFRGQTTLEPTRAEILAPVEPVPQCRRGSLWKTSAGAPLSRGSAPAGRSRQRAAGWRDGRGGGTGGVAGRAGWQTLRRKPVVPWHGRAPLSSPSEPWDAARAGRSRPLPAPPAYGRSGPSPAAAPGPEFEPEPGSVSGSAFGPGPRSAAGAGAGHGTGSDQLGPGASPVPERPGPGRPDPTRNSLQPGGLASPAWAGLGRPRSRGRSRVRKGPQESGRRPKRSNGQWIMNALPITEDSGMVPSLPGSVLCPRESCEAPRWSPITHRRPSPTVTGPNS
ncbi:hypothetical protein CLV63_111142 [Murinocardiopsis flavida]|uniref:Uncharacterized protein n=1 Tax=Murinocardiopsis flavida TaxID=645275 RepID=A0A2P8DH51_9ACTN|nr:hypothetical protein CLV63_111142 [Murinocardiopsis flavida]